MNMSFAHSKSETRHRTHEVPRCGCARRGNRAGAGGVPSQTCCGTSGQDEGIAPSSPQSYSSQGGVLDKSQKLTELI